MKNYLINSFFFKSHFHLKIKNKKKRNYFSTIKNEKYITQYYPTFTEMNLKKVIFF